MRRPGRLWTLLRLLWTQRVTGFSPSGEPHFDDAASAEFRRLLGKARLYLEYGAGGSTLLAAKLGIETVSVESDRFYARAVVAALPADSPNRMIHVDVGITGEWGMPLFKRPTMRRLARWRAYPAAPFSDPHALPTGRFPDLVLVDGRFRIACALEVARRAALAGAATTLCFDDYEGRPYYHAVENWLGIPSRFGRMAFFALCGSHLVPQESVAEAARDYR